MSLDVLPTKKRKDLESSQDTPASKKSKKDTKDKSHKRDKKGTPRSSAVDGEFRVVKASVKVSIPPIFANDPMSGVEEMLDSLVMRYVPALHGVILCHSNVHFLSSTAAIKWDCPFANCSVGFDATVWSPQIGMKLTGNINLCSPDHISLLVHRTFNVSIPRHHIPTDSWEFAYGAAENDPEFGSIALAAQNDETMEKVAGVHTDGVAGETPGAVDGDMGKWFHKVTGDPLGGDNGILEFTVIRLAIANEMLSLVGSLQPDPFSPEHVAKPAALSHIQFEADTKMHDNGHIPSSDGPEEDLEDDTDTFRVLGKMIEATAQETTVMAQANGDTKSKKKSKKKDAGPSDDTQLKEEGKKKTEKKKKKPSEG